MSRGFEGYGSNTIGHILKELGLFGGFFKFVWLPSSVSWG